MLVRRDAFDAAGGFDPGFFLYKEEEDLCLRLRYAGGRVVYEPAVTVRHAALGAGRGPHLEASIRRFRDKHVGAGPRVALAVRAHRAAVVWEGRVRRLFGRRA
jgi:GT2 family glycosyltransferase